MRIQNNITAMNTHRQYTINNDNVAKAAEKLSSGYRINRAGDDAAGLAISEKMRSQIRGLNMATKNSQDAISLVQTAEGALQETHSMLQRMNELAVQAATGTNQEFDRAALAKEFEQLKKEINDVAEQTTFNNMKILDGSLSYSTGYQRSAQTAGVTVSATAIDDVATKGVAATNQATPAAAATTGKAGVWEYDISGATFDASGELSLTIGNGTDTAIVLTGATGKAYSAMTDAEKGAIAVKATSSGAWDTNGFTVTVDGAAGKLTITQKAPTAVGQTVPTITGTGVTEKTAAVAATAKSAEVSTATFNEESLKAGDKITIDDKTFVLTDDTHTADTAKGEIGIAWKEDADKTAAKLVTEITKNANKPTNVTIAAVGTTGIKVTQDTPALSTEGTAYKSTSIKYEPASADATKYRSTIEIDSAKMKDGDVFEIEVGGKKVEVTFNEADYKTDANKTASEKFAKKVYDELIAKGIAAKDLTQKGNAITFTGGKVTEANLNLKTDATDGVSTNAIRIQVGALEDEQLAVSIDAMNTKGLGLDGFNLDSQNEAGMAITAVRAAVNKVSDQRATLGAMQNRLDHKIANLKVSSENLSAAESRIRDVDMASEMTNFTKNNILSQAATAMLAQANALPQNVLSLLG